MALPFIVAAVLGKAAATKLAAGKAVSVGAKATAHHHARAGILHKVVDEAKSKAEDAVKDKAKEKAKGWWSKRKLGDSDA